MGGLESERGGAGRSAAGGRPAVFTTAAAVFRGAGRLRGKLGGPGSCLGVKWSLLRAQWGWRGAELGPPREPWLGGRNGGAAALAVLGEGVGHRCEEWEACVRAQVRRELKGGVRGLGARVEEVASAARVAVALKWGGEGSAPRGGSAAAARQRGRGSGAASARALKCLRARAAERGERKRGERGRKSQRFDLVQT